MIYKRRHDTHDGGRLDVLTLPFVEDRPGLNTRTTNRTGLYEDSQNKRNYLHNCTGTMSTPQPFNVDHAHQPSGRGHDPSIVTEGPLGSWFTLLDACLWLNDIHSDFRGVFFHELDALLKEADDEAYVRRMPDYLRRIRSQYMFVRVERPPRSKRFVMGYVKCERVFSFEPRYRKMRLRLNCVQPSLLRDVESGENAALRLACVGETDYERAVAMHSDTRDESGVLLTPLSVAIYGNDEESAVALLDGGDNPNEVDRSGMNALHWAAWKGCRPPLFNRILAMILDVNAGHNGGETALLLATAYNHLDVVISLMNHPEINLNVQGRLNVTALHVAVLFNQPAILAQLLSDDKIDCRLKDNFNKTPLKYAIDGGRAECVQLLKDRGAPG